MKKFLALATLLALVCVSTAANADVYRAWKSVGFRNTSATVAGPIDSSFKSHTGAVADTSQPFTLEGLAFVGYPLGADSLSLFDVFCNVTSGATSTAAAVSAGFVLQGSVDGVTWDAGVSAVVSENLNGAGLAMYKGYHTTRLGAVTVAQTTNLEIGVYPLYRLIVTQNSGNVGKFWLNISYWRTTNSPQW
jgi:hypothetical protein